jgi:hypothetical protein
MHHACVPKLQKQGIPSGSLLSAHHTSRHRGACTQVHPWDLVLIEDVAPGYPSLAVVKKLWQTPAGIVQAQVSWMYRFSDLPKEVQQAAQCTYPPPVGKRCAVKRAESEEFLPEVGCMRELLFSDHSDVIEAKDIVHTARYGGEVNSEG